MTRKEWMEIHYPDKILRGCCGGVLGCPDAYAELVNNDASIPKMLDCEFDSSKFRCFCDECRKCWNREMEVPNK